MEQQTFTQEQAIKLLRTPEILRDYSVRVEINSAGSTFCEVRNHTGELEFRLWSFEPQSLQTLNQHIKWLHESIESRNNLGGSYHA